MFAILSLVGQFVLYNGRAIIVRCIEDKLINDVTYNSVTSLKGEPINLENKSNCYKRTFKEITT